MSDLRKITLLVSYSGQGGVEVVTNKLCQGFLNQGYAVDLLMVKAKGPHVKNIPEGVNQIKFKQSSTWLCLPELIWHLWKHKPRFILAAKHRGVALAVTAKALANSDTKIIGQIHTNTSATFANKSNSKRNTRFREMRKYYPRLDALVGVSQGVLDDIESIIGKLPFNKALPNALFDDTIYTVAEQPIDHPWLIESEIPVVMSAGRMTEQKDFATLVKAFAIATQSQPLRLMIIGEGEQKQSLEALSEQLNISDVITFIPFQTNLPAWLDKADIFACSSAWEGLGNVVAEALAVGKPIASTDCKSGPREILEDGKFGELTPVADAEALAQAILKVTANRAEFPTQAAKDSARRFHLDVSAKQYLSFFDSVLARK